MVAKLDRLARSLPDARNIVDDLTQREKNSASAAQYTTPPTPSGQLLFNVLAMVAEFEADLVGLWHAGGHTSAELADLFSVARSTVYRAVERAQRKTATAR